MLYINSEWVEILKDNGLASFDDIWNLERSWLEEPNKRRGGWSGVIRKSLKTSGKRETGIYIKRQEDYKTFTLRHPIHGILTLEKEFQNFMKFHCMEIPSPTPVYFAQRKKYGVRQSILITAELAGYRSLEDYMNRWQGAHHRRITEFLGCDQNQKSRQICHSPMQGEDVINC